MSRDSQCSSLLLPLGGLVCFSSVSCGSGAGGGASSSPPPVGTNTVDQNPGASVRTWSSPTVRSPKAAVAWVSTWSGVSSSKSTVTVTVNAAVPDVVAGRVSRPLRLVLSSEPNCTWIGAPSQSVVSWTPSPSTVTLTSSRSSRSPAAAPPSRVSSATMLSPSSAASNPNSPWIVSPGTMRNSLRSIPCGLSSRSAETSAQATSPTRATSRFPAVMLPPSTCSESLHSAKVPPPRRSAAPAAPASRPLVLLFMMLLSLSFHRQKPGGHCRVVARESGQGGGVRWSWWFVGGGGGPQGSAASPSGCQGSARTSPEPQQVIDSPTGNVVAGQVTVTLWSSVTWMFSSGVCPLLVTV